MSQWGNGEEERWNTSIGGGDNGDYFITDTAGQVYKLRERRFIKVRYSIDFACIIILIFYFIYDLHKTSNNRNNNRNN